MLKDRFERIHDYLRISLTDRCNLRCSYCMPYDLPRGFYAHSVKMTAAEVEHIAAAFVGQGIKKIRLTGGEPLLRKDAGEILERLSAYPVELALTTNGVFIDEYLTRLQKAGLRSINVSLDSLRRERFFSITGRDAFDRVFGNIRLLLNEKFHVKVNVVVIRGENDDELLDFVRWTKEAPVHIRFIEFMPFSGNAWDSSKVVTHRQILDALASEFHCERTETHANDTAKPYRISGHAGTFAVISTMSEPFCSGCNRMRITTDGKMKNCLFSRDETDLLTPLRRGEDIVPLIRECLEAKKEKLGGQFEGLTGSTVASEIINRSMVQIGG
ncbi:MAG: GTP 3',8-cyclase MoaA [Saprospiraceae bacterium]|jgi:cyclic pyranopterin phosphate synthase|nr:GTP 3',8-cyclase MoaA [Saprospiraceae bacterium]MBP9209295.1 GTP 3',8-cyclase MoaA [Saprospiraceae bacterium]